MNSSPPIHSFAKLTRQADIEPHIADLKSNDAVEEIRLSGNTLGVGACKALADVLRTKKNLKALSSPICDAFISPNININIIIIPNHTFRAAENQWQSFKRKHERASGQRFPGYLGAENIVKAVAALGVNISVGEARELILLIGERSTQH